HDPAEVAPVFRTRPVIADLVARMRPHRRRVVHHPVLDEAEQMGLLLGHATDPVRSPRSSRTNAMITAAAVPSPLNASTYQNTPLSDAAINRTNDVRTASVAFQVNPGTSATSDASISSSIAMSVLLAS